MARDVFVTMTAVALATETITVGTGIVNPYTRHPALTASAIASIDELSGGRVFLGIGAGGSLSLDPLGISRDEPLRLVREAIATFREMLSADSGSSEFGRNAEIWFAGRGPKMLRQAGELVDGVFLEFLYKPGLSDYVDRVREGAAVSGNDPALCYATMVVPDRSGFDAVRPQMTYRLVDSQPDVKATLGMSSDDVDAIRGAMPKGLVEAARFVRDEWIDPFVIVGTAEECAVELHGLMTTHAFDEFALVLTDLSDVPASLRFGADVLALAGEMS